MAVCHDNDISEHTRQHQVTAVFTFLRGWPPNGHNAEWSSMCDISDRCTTHARTCPQVNTHTHTKKNNNNERFFILADSINFIPVPSSVPVHL